MKNTVDSNLRVFMIVTSTGKSAFCNIEMLNTCISWLGCNAGYFKIYHFWDNKQKRISGKALRQIAESNGCKLNFHY